MKKRNHNLLRLAYVLPLLLAIVLWIAKLSRSLEYDELWTCFNFVKLDWGKIFFSLATPNNHPINTVLIKLVTSLGFVNILWLRLPVFLAGLIAAGVLGNLAFRLRRSSHVAAITTVWLAALSIPWGYYATTARGYALQLMFLLFFLLAVVAREQAAERDRWKWSVLLSVSALLSVLTIATSVLILAPAGMLHWLWILKRRENWRKSVDVLLAYLLAAGLSLGYLLLNFNDLRAGQGFGVPIGSVSGFFRFFANTVAILCGKYLWILAIAGGVGLLLRREWKLALALFWMILFPFLGAIFFLAGPVRVYLPVLPFLILLMAVAGDALWHRYGRMAGVTALVGIGLVAAASYLRPDSEWVIPDWGWIFRNEVAALADNTIPIYPAGAGYPVLWNNYPASIEDQEKRIDACLIAGRGELALFYQVDEISGMDRNYGEIRVPHHGKVSRRPSRYGVIDLVPIRRLTADGAVQNGVVEVVVFLKTRSAGRIQRMIKEFRFHPRWDFYPLNLFLTNNKRATDQRSCYYGLIFGKIPSADVPELLWLEKVADNEVQLFQLDAAK